MYDDEPAQDSDDAQPSNNSLARLTDSLLGLYKDAGKAIQRVRRFLHQWSKDNGCNLGLEMENSSTPTQALSYILLCVNTRRNRSRLVQIPVGKDAKDGWLFSEIRRQYFRVRGWRSYLTLGTVDSIKFVKVYHVLHELAEGMH